MMIRIHAIVINTELKRIKTESKYGANTILNLIVILAIISHNVYAFHSLEYTFLAKPLNQLIVDLQQKYLGLYIKHFSNQFVFGGCLNEYENIKTDCHELQFLANVTEVMKSVYEQGRSIEET